MPLLAVAESRYRWAYGPSGQRRVISWVQVGREGRHASIGSSDFFLCVKFDFELLLGRDAQAQQSFSQQTLAINQPLRKLSLLPQQATEGREGIGLHLSDFLQSTHANKPSAPPGAGPGRELEHDVKDGKGQSIDQHLLPAAEDKCNLRQNSRPVTILRRVDGFTSSRDHRPSRRWMYRARVSSTTSRRSPGWDSKSHLVLLEANATRLTHGKPSRDDRG